MRLSLALAAAGALAALTVPAAADDGIPVPERRARTPVVRQLSPEENLAALNSQSAMLARREAALQKKLRVLKTVGLRGALAGEHDPLGQLVWDVFTKQVAHRLKGEIAAIETTEAFIAGQEAVARKQIDDAKAAALAKRIADEAAAEAERQKAAAEEAARQEQAALAKRIDDAVNSAKDAWKSDGIVNRNTGDHSWDMWCLALASTAWETAVGHAIPVLEHDSAFHAYQACANAGLIHEGADAPRGALVFWPAGPTGFGHVAISNGDGTVVSNYNRSDSPTGINPAAPIANFGPPIGWVDPKDLK